MHKINGTGGIEKYNVQSSSRYIRIYGIKRATEWGYSLYEVEVFNLPAVNIKDETNDNLPQDYKLENNYPNPFNPTTTIGFGIQEKKNVRLSVLNILGEEIKVLLNEEKEAGYNSINFNGSDLPSGVYFYQLKAGSYVNTKKMLLLK